MMNKEDILKILESAKDKNGDVPMRLVRQAFEKLPEPCTDTISRQAAIEAINRAVTKEAARWSVEELPSAQPDQKTGKWIEEDDGWDGVFWRCSECNEPFYLVDGTPVDNEYHFCPNCGADMRQREENK